MRWIIAVPLVAVLTACDAEPQVTPAASQRDVTASTSDTSALSATSASPRSARQRPAERRRNVLFIGTSLTAGYGVGAEVAFPAILQQKIDSAGLPFRVVNAGISGETSAGGLRRIDWALQQPLDVLVLELGANDGLRGIDPAEMRRNLAAILKRTRERYPEAAVVLAGMEAPPNLGNVYTSRFRRTFPELAREHGAQLVPFLLEGVAAQPRFNIEDGIHPNLQGHRIIADNVWRVLGPLLLQRVAADHPLPDRTSDSSVRRNGY